MTAPSSAEALWPRSQACRRGSGCTSNQARSVSANCRTKGKIAASVMPRPSPQRLAPAASGTSSTPSSAGGAMLGRIRSMALGVSVAIKVGLERAIDGFDQSWVLALQPALRIAPLERPAHDLETFLDDTPIDVHKHRNRALGRRGDQFLGLAREFYLADIAGRAADQQGYTGAHSIGTAPEAVEDRPIAHVARAPGRRHARCRAAWRAVPAGPVRHSRRAGPRCGPSGRQDNSRPRYTAAKRDPRC